MKNKRTYIRLTIGLALLTACSTHDDVVAPNDVDQIINVGGVSTDDMMATTVTTRGTVGAETLDWLKTGLEQGVNMLYFKDKNKPQYAVLKLETSGYTLTHEGTACKWLDNGEHTFEGVYAPAELKKTKDSQVYDDLVHYTAIPPSTKISATIDKITIPLQHRLARVQAYVLIDTTMNTKLKGYDAANHNGENTMLRFCNVQTLDSVNTAGTPVWKTERKAIPHYLGELGSIVEDNNLAFETFRTYEEKSTGKLYFPTDGEWKIAHQAYEKEGKGESSGYICTDYGKVPSYDIIVRPTYTKDTYAMYDEATITAEGDNKIDFELTLANDLEYEKSFTFDLNANDETVVFLRVSPERIDYNSAGSRLWKEVSYGDSYYGVNNGNGNTLSKAGSSWQRAYTNDTVNIGVTDGHRYDADSEDESAQYVSTARWVELLKLAKEGSAHHGHYFILKNDIEIDLNDFPADFVFTGHLDALDHKIKLINATTEHDWLFAGIKEGWQAEIVNAVIEDGKLFKDKTDTTAISGYVNNCKDKEGTIENIPEIPTY